MVHRCAMTLLCAICVIQPALGAVAEIVRYVDTGSAGGNGTTSGLVGATAAYASLAALETAEDGVIGNLPAYGGGDGSRMTVHLNRTGAGGIDTTPVTFDAGSWTTSATNYIEIIQDDFPADGLFNSTKYVIHNNDADTAAVQIQTPYFRVTGLQVQATETSTSNRHGVYITTVAAGGSDIRLVNVISKGVVSGTGGSIGVYVNDADAVVTCVNCAIYDYFITGDPGFVGYRNLAGTSYLYNCVVYHNTYGVFRDAGTVTAYNCAVGNTDAGNNWHGTITIDYCCDDDADAQTHGFSPNGGNWTLEFNSPSTGDFTLLATATGCTDNGTADPGGVNQPDTDIVGTARPQGAAWDIGVYEYSDSGSTDTQMWWGRRRQ